MAVLHRGPGRSFEFSNEEERREAIDHIRLMARRKYLGEREARRTRTNWAFSVGEARRVRAGREQVVPTFPKRDWESINGS